MARDLQLALALALCLLFLAANQVDGQHAAMYEAFPAGDFDVGGKQATFRPGTVAGQYNLAIETLPILIDLEENWLIADSEEYVPFDDVFVFGDLERSGVEISQGGFLTFNDSSSQDIDCFNSTTYSEEDIIVAFCSRDVLTLVRHAVLDDRLVVQWALPGGVCPVDLTPLPVPSPRCVGVIGAAPPAVSNLTVSQAELFFNDSTIRLSWATNSSCPTTIGIGVEGIQATPLDFLTYSSPKLPPALNCSNFSVFGPDGAFPCTQQAVAVQPQSLSTVVLFKGVEDLLQQVMTITNVAGQNISVTGATLAALAPGADPTGSADLTDLVLPTGLLGRRRRLHQDSSDLNAGLAALQYLFQSLSEDLNVLGPSIEKNLTSLQQAHGFFPPAPGPVLPSQARLVALHGVMTPAGGPGQALSPDSAMPAEQAPMRLPTLQSVGGRRRRLAQESAAQNAQAPDAASSNPNSALSPGPALGPLSLEAGGVAAVGIKETPRQEQVLQFVPAPGCNQSRIAGPCSELSSRWYFDAELQRCDDFVFGGCMGNLNNFASKASCQRACLGGVVEEEPQSAGISVPTSTELVFLANALSAVSWVTLDATSDVLPQGASAALHLTYNSTFFEPGVYSQNITITSNDPARPSVLLQPNLVVVCGRLAEFQGFPAATNVSYAYLDGAKPSWADDSVLDADEQYVYFEAWVVYNKPVLNLSTEQITAEADGAAGVVLSVDELAESEGFGPMCAGFRVRGAVPLPGDYADLSEGTLLSLTVADVQSVYEELVPSFTANKTIFNSLPQCTFYGQGMSFGGDFGLTVNSGMGAARAVLVCTTPLGDFCSSCIKAQFSNSSVTPAVAFVGLVPGMTSQYDVEIAWPRGEYFGELNFTVGCQATDDFGRPLETVQPLRVAVVEQFQLPIPVAFSPSPAPSP